MHIRRGVYLRLAERLQFKSYSRLSKIVLAGLLCLVVAASTIMVFKNTFAAPPCPCTAFTPQTPATAPSVYNQPGGIEVGMKFKVDRTGYISGARFYKVAGMTGVHTASIWSPMGVRMTTASFTSESAAGWQEVNFAPIAVTADTIYTVSVFMTDGNYAATPAYFTAPIINEPFIVPQNGQAADGYGRDNQGVYDASGASVYPISSFNAANYWVDAVYVSSPNLVAPAVTSNYPSTGETNVAVSAAVSATFDKQLTSSSVSTDTFVVSDAQGQTLPGVVSYDRNTSTVKFIANDLLQTNATYIATLKGGVGNVIMDYDGHKLGADYQWTFTTSSMPLTCPCSLKNKQPPSEATTYRESSPGGLELGLKIIPSAKGYITAIRFYKPIVNEQMSHIGNIWDGNGNNLASVTFTSESEYGWQEATLSTPLSVMKDQLYIVSFGMTNTAYVAKINGLATTLTSPGLVAYPSGDGRNAALGSGTANSVYAPTTGAYPSSPASSNQDYMIDAVFTLASSDSEPLRVVKAQPSADSNGVKRNVIVSATFDQTLDPLTVNAGSVRVRDATGMLIAGQATYDAAKRAVTFDPVSDLVANLQYTATITTSVKDVRGKNLPVEYNWSFTAGSPASIDMNQGNGGPVLIVTATGDNYGKYYAEILRTEGINYFDVRDINDVTPAVLGGYRAVILSSMALASSHVDMLRTWVTNGGHLVAMRPDKKLAGLLGLEDAGATVANAYLKVNPATAPGLGIVSETMQYKGVADKYMINDATTVAKLYVDATIETSYPAVTTRSVGAGTAMAYSYDLARSVIGLHQGNQAWAGIDRNGDAAARTTDLFYGGAAFDMQPDWLDSSKMDIPQADEQQRLLVNLLTDAMRKSLPAPRFWYLPNDQKAAIVFVGDDHGLGNDTGTEKQMDGLLNKNKTNCSVMDWECALATHYIYTSSGLSPVRAGQFDDYGFEIGAHPVSRASCGMENSYDQLNADYASNLASWRTKYNSLPYQQTSRFHCYAWPSWDWMPRVDYANGVRYDLNTVAYPASWVGGTQSPMITGSGMNMRLTDAGGGLIDVRQGVTNFENTSVSTTSITTMLDNALGAKGYYGIFGSHYDMSDAYSDTMYDIAQSRQVPIITADQALTWLDGRSGSNFRDLTSNELGKVTFSIDVAEGAYGLQAMMPLQDAGGVLSSIKVGGQPTTYRTEIIKGVNYALFTAKPGSYEVLYTDFGNKLQAVDDVAASSSIHGAKVAGVAASEKKGEPVDSTATQPVTGVTNLPSEGISDDIAEVAKAWWSRPLVLLITGSGVAVLGAAVWLFRLRRRLS